MRDLADEPPQKRQHLLEHCGNLRGDPTDQHRKQLKTAKGDVFPVIRSGAQHLSAGAVSTFSQDVTAAAAALVCLHSHTNCQSSGHSAASTALQYAGTFQSRSGSASAVDSSWQAETGGSSANGPTSRAPFQALNHGPREPLGRSSSSSNSALNSPRVAQLRTLAAKQAISKAVGSKEAGQEQIRCKCGNSEPSHPFDSCNDRTFHTALFLIQIRCARRS